MNRLLPLSPLNHPYVNDAQVRAIAISTPIIIKSSDSAAVFVLVRTTASLGGEVLVSVTVAVVAVVTGCAVIVARVVTVCLGGTTVTVVTGPGTLTVLAGRVTVRPLIITVLVVRGNCLVMTLVTVTVGLTMVTSGGGGITGSVGIGGITEASACAGAEIPATTNSARIADAIATNFTLLILIIMI